MALYAHPDVLDGGLNVIKNDCNSVVLIAQYTFGDTYNTVINNTIAQAAMAPSDFAIEDAGDNRAVISSGTKTAPATITAESSHIAFLDTVGHRVLYVTEETTGQSVFTDNPVHFPSITYTSRQPIQA